MNEVKMEAKMKTGSWTQLPPRQNLPFAASPFLLLVRYSFFGISSNSFAVITNQQQLLELE
jgi:hypothetical protein